MNKKLATVLFFLAATAANILIVIVLALALLVPYALWIAPKTGGALNPLVLLVIILGAMAGSFPIYRALITWLQNKIDFEKYFDPIVGSWVNQKKLRR